MKTLSSVSNLYKIALTGKFDEQHGNYLNAIGNLQKKIMQITGYCKTYDKTVVLYLDESTPFFFYNFLRQLNVTVIPVLESDKEDENLNSVETKSPKAFFENNCEFILVVCTKETKDDFEFETPTKFFILQSVDTRIAQQVKDPNITLKDAVQKVKQMSDPYNMFWHDLLYEIVPFNYYDEIMQTKPDLNALTDREFANVDKNPKKRRKNRK